MPDFVRLTTVERYRRADSFFLATGELKSPEDFMDDAAAAAYREQLEQRAARVSASLAFTRA